MTTQQVLEAATGRAADALECDEVGVLRPGRAADFIVLDADPLADISNTRQISAVYLRGQEVDRSALRARWTGR